MAQYNYDDTEEIISLDDPTGALEEDDNEIIDLGVSEEEVDQNEQPTILPKKKKKKKKVTDQKVADVWKKQAPMNLGQAIVEKYQTQKKDQEKKAAAKKAAAKKTATIDFSTLKPPTNTEFNQPTNTEFNFGIEGQSAEYKKKQANILAAKAKQDALDQAEFEARIARKDARKQNDEFLVKTTPTKDYMSSLDSEIAAKIKENGKETYVTDGYGGGGEPGIPETRKIKINSFAPEKSEVIDELKKAVKLQ